MDRRRNRTEDETRGSGIQAGGFYARQKSVAMPKGIPVVWREESRVMTSHSKWIKKKHRKIHYNYIGRERVTRGLGNIPCINGSWEVPGSNEQNKVGEEHPAAITRTTHHAREVTAALLRYRVLDQGEMD